MTSPNFQTSEVGTATLHMAWANANALTDGVRLDTFEPLTRAAVPSLISDMPSDDWDDLLNAVKTRLRQTVGEQAAATLQPGARDAAGQVQNSVLECVLALDQLHTTLAHELGRRRQLERKVLDAQIALAQARAELAGTQTGERRARHLARHDSLTSLPNRSFFHERLADALAHAQPGRQTLALLYLDLDGLKPINDVHGHDAGDELLRVVASRLTRAVRAEDMVSRLGGDEFACLLDGMPPGRVQLVRLARKVFDAVSAPFKVGAINLVVRPSIGIAMGPTDGETADVLLKNADTAMYRAKRQHSGHAFFDQRAGT